MGDQIPVYLTPHKVSLLIIVRHYLQSDIMDPDAKHELGLFLIEEISVCLIETLTDCQAIKDFSEKPLQDLLVSLEGVPEARERLLETVCPSQFLLILLSWASFLRKALLLVSIGFTISYKVWRSFHPLSLGIVEMLSDEAMEDGMFDFGESLHTVWS